MTTGARLPVLTRQVYCASCQRLVSARKAKDGQLYPYGHTAGDYKRDAQGKLTVAPGRCDGHLKPGRRAGYPQADGK